MARGSLRSAWLPVVLILALAAGARGAEPGDGAPQAPATWPQWRGPHRDGRIEGCAELARSPGAGRARTKLASSAGSQLLGSDRERDARLRHRNAGQAARSGARADRTTGQARWETSWEGALSVPFFAKSSGDWIGATPAYDGESLFVAGMRDVLVCLDAQTGATRWQLDFVKELGTPLPDFGFVSSPLVDGEHVYVQAGAAVCQLDKRTGKITWRALQDEGGMYGSAFSSPLLSDLAGRRQLVVQTRERLAGIDPKSGDVLWSQAIPAFRGMNILTPTVSGESVFTSAYGGKSLLFKLTKDGDAPSLVEAWTNKVAGYMSSPLVIDGSIYLHLRNQRFTCIDLATGESRWTTKPFGQYWSLVSNGDRILALDRAR